MADNSNNAQRKSGDDEGEVADEKSWMSAQSDKVKDKTTEWSKQLVADLKKVLQTISGSTSSSVRSPQHVLVPAVAGAYGPAVFLSAVASVFGHPGRNLGAMLETLVFALVGTLVGTGWVTFASYISDQIYDNSVKDAHAFRAVILVISLIIHGYLRSKVPKVFVGVLLFLLTVIIQMVMFPEFSSGKVAVVTVSGLELALETLRDATDFFVCPSDEMVKKTTLNKKEKEKVKDTLSNSSATVGDSKNSKKDTSKNEKEDNKEEEEEEEKPEDPLKKLLSAKDQLRKALASSKATLKETSFEIGYSCLPPARLHPISSRGLEALVMSLLTLIGACETKHMVMSPNEPNEDAQEEEKKDDDDSESDKNSLKEKIENIRPKREAEVANEDFLRHLLERVDGPLEALRGMTCQSIHAVVACIEFSCNVPVTSENAARKPAGIPLKEIDVYVGAIENALEEFDITTREALHKAAEKASEEEEVEFDILPREEIFLVSSFLLNFRLAAKTILGMLKEGRDMIEEYDSVKGKKSFHLPDFKSKKWLYSGESEQSETMDPGARENISRYQKATGNPGSGGQKGNPAQKGRITDSRRTPKSTTKAAPQKKPKPKKESEDEEVEKKPWTSLLRGVFADVVDWVLTDGHFHYALKLAIGGMLLSWPAFVPEFAFFFYNYRGLWVVVIYILVFENSVGTSIQVFAYRTVGTIAGSLWGYAAWSAGHGNPYVIAVMLYFGFLIAFYIQLNTRYVKAGMVLTISMVIVSVGTVIEYIPGTVPGTALENFLKRSVAMVIGGSGALIVQAVIFPVQARAKLVETVGLAVLKINEMESAIAFGVDQTTNLEDLRNENAVKAFYKARKKAEVSLAAASAYLSVSTQEPRIKGSFANDKMIYKEIIYVLHQIIDRMENVLQLRLQLGSAVLENYYVYVYKYRRNVAAAITITLYAVHEALTSKLPLPQYFPSARLAQLRMVNRVRQILMESVSATDRSKEAHEAEDAKRILRVEFMSYNATSAALEQVIEWLEELVDLTKLLRGAAEFRVGLLSRPTYREWVRQISVGGEADGPSSPGEKEKEKRKDEAVEEQQHHPLAKVPSRTKKQDYYAEVLEDENGLPETLRRVHSRHRENRADIRRLSHSSHGVPERVDALRRAAKGL
ncbi:hypothetical protein ABW20_dc0100633 [Dactylellina cionopaga]|nr:hypothetical protein ABW20_dc0100633 [Dactylellina cionopaga]